MVELNARLFFGDTPFVIETESIRNGKGAWDSSKVSIFRDKLLIGEYIRNYPTLSTTTFFPFRLDEDWYALYSANYTCTRVMRLHEDSIEDWCGEEPDVAGFCPAEFYVTNSTFGFVSGCHWGDDSSWKLRFVDLSKVPEKKFEITEKFGYWVLPNIPLGECVTVNTDDGTVIHLLKEECFRID